MLLQLGLLWITRGDFINKTSVVIYKDNTSHEILQEICAGLEEEGVLWDVFDKSENDPKVLARHAAVCSILHVGIGLYKEHAAITTINMPEGTCILEQDILNNSDARKVGYNAARIVKKVKLL